MSAHLGPSVQNCYLEHIVLGAAQCPGKMWIESFLEFLSISTRPRQAAWRTSQRSTGNIVAASGPWATREVFQQTLIFSWSHRKRPFLHYITPEGMVRIHLGHACLPGQNRAHPWREPGWFSISIISTCPYYILSLYLFPTHISSPEQAFAVFKINQNTRFPLCLLPICQKYAN